MMFAVGVGASLDVSVLMRQVRCSETSGGGRADGAAGRRALGALVRSVLRWQQMDFNFRTSAE